MKDLETKSKYLSYLLRHEPEAAKLTIDREGWVSVEQIVQNTKLTRDEIIEIASTDSKSRYSIRNDSIRANQGHSTKFVKMKSKTAVPPPKLYPGASQPSLDEIRRHGLLPMSRHHVHLSHDIETAESVGGRRRRGYVILEIDAASMLKDGHKFFVSENGVWLADSIPPKYLKELT